MLIHPFFLFQLPIMVIQFQLKLLNVSGDLMQEFTELPQKSMRR